LEGLTKSAAGRVDSQLRFNFSIEHGDVDHLMLNGVQLYPIDPAVMALTYSLTADQLVKTPEGNWNYAASPRLGYSLSISSPELSPDQQLGLISIRLEIEQLGRTFMSGFPVIEVKLLETPSRKLMIGDVAIKEQTPTEAGQECTSIICKWKAIIAAKISQLKASHGCGGSRAKHESTASSVAESSSPAALVKGGPMKPVKPNHHGHHGGHRAHRHRHRHRHSGFARFLRGLVFHVFIPIMIGVVVGIMASLVGMVVGHIAIFIWRMLFRRGERAPCRRVQHEESLGKDDENSKSLLGHDNPPPVYEEAPAYEDAVVDEKA